MSDIVQKLWGFCHTLRHDGVDYGDYIEQITYLLFLKMADERAAAVPRGLDWNSLKGRSGTALTDHYADTVLRLPRGTFTPYSQGVKANVIFLQKGRPTEAVWIFDARSNVPGITKKDRPLTAQHFAEFEVAYGKDPNGLGKRKDTGETGRFRRFPVSAIRDRQFKLDVTWLKDDSIEDSDELPEPEDLAGEAINELEAVVDDLREIVELLGKEEGVDK
jgi:type I restriction-modification system DNA methylase subunit